MKFYRKGRENEKYLQAFNKGKKARKENYHPMANPYPMRSILFNRWRQGFMSDGNYMW